MRSFTGQHRNSFFYLQIPILTRSGCSVAQPSPYQWSASASSYPSYSVRALSVALLPPPPTHQQGPNWICPPSAGRWRLLGRLPFNLANDCLGRRCIATQYLLTSYLMRLRDVLLHTLCTLASFYYEFCNCRTIKLLPVYNDVSDNNFQRKRRLPFNFYSSSVICDVINFICRPIFIRHPVGPVSYYTGSD